MLIKNFVWVQLPFFFFSLLSSLLFLLPLFSHLLPATLRNLQEYLNSLDPVRFPLSGKIHLQSDCIFHARWYRRWLLCLCISISQSAAAAHLLSDWCWADSLCWSQVSNDPCLALMYIGVMFTTSYNGCFTEIHKWGICRSLHKWDDWWMVGSLLDGLPVIEMVNLIHWTVVRTDYWYSPQQVQCAGLEQPTSERVFSTAAGILTNTNTVIAVILTTLLASVKFWAYCT